MRLQSKHSHRLGDIYAGGATVADRAVANMLDTLPGTRFLYNPPDTILLMRAVREAVQDDQKATVRVTAANSGYTAASRDCPPKRIRRAAARVGT